MQLIADSGSTKTAWILAKTGLPVRELRTIGISPYFMEDTAIAQVLLEVRQELGNLLPQQIFFYGTGCHALEQRQRLEHLLAQCFPEAYQVQVHTDIAGAARASCQRTAGITGILGTGSNACRFDGQQILQTAGGLGFILGDEGSGAAIGKELIIAYLNQELPQPLATAFQLHFELTRDNILQAVYKRPFPNRYLAAFMPFIHAHRHEPVIQSILQHQFFAFLTRNIAPLITSNPLPIHLVGSIAHYFSQEIDSSAKQLSLQVASITQHPLPGLARYHQ